MTRAADGIYSRRVDELWLGGQKVYPDGADPVLLPSHATEDWTQGDITEIIPANTITTPFVLVGIAALLATIVGDAFGDWQLDLYYGASDTYLGSVRFSFFTYEYRTNVVLRGGVGGSPIPANSRIRGRARYGDVTGSGAGGIAVSLEYVEVM